VILIVVAVWHTNRWRWQRMVDPESKSVQRRTVRLVCDPGATDERFVLCVLYVFSHAEMRIQLLLAKQSHSPLCVRFTVFSFFAYSLSYYLGPTCDWESLKTTNTDMLRKMRSR